MQVFNFFTVFTAITLNCLIAQAQVSSQAKHKPLPATFWNEKFTYANYVEGTYNKNVSVEAELVSFYSTFEASENNASKNLKVAFYLPKEINNHLILGEEKTIMSYYRMEATLRNAKRNAWNELSNWSTKLINEKNIPYSNLGVLVFLGMKNQVAMYAPVVVYQNTPPKAIETYRAAIRVGKDIKGGIYRVYRGANSVDEGKISQKLGGAVVNIRIPVAKIGTEAGELKVSLKLEGENGDQEEITFYFYHTTFK